MKIIIRTWFTAGAAATLAGLGFVLLPLGDAVWAGRPMFRSPIEVGESAYSHWLPIDDPHARVGLKLTVAPRLGTQEMRRDGNGEYVGLYRFPMHYRVRDEAGKLLIDQWVIIDATRDRTLAEDYTEWLDPRPIVVEAEFDAFPVSTDKIRVEALLLPDRLYSADIDQAELRLFREPLPITGYVRTGLAAAFVGLLLMISGLAGEFALARRQQKPAPVPVAVPERSRVLAFRARHNPSAAPSPAVADHRRAL